MPPKHSFTVPRGPCMNPVCPHLVCCDITCVCTEGGPEEHSLFAPLCETLRWNDPNLRRNTAEAKFPGKAAIEYGRSHSQRKDREEHMGGHRKQEEIRWKRLSDGERLALGCACLPPNAVACNDCAKEARRLVVDEVGRSAHHKKIVLKNAGRMVDSLPDEAVSSLASYTTQQVWLGEAEEGAETRKQHGVWRTSGKSPFEGGTCHQAQVGSGAIGAGLMLLVLGMLGSVSACISALVAAVGAGLFWAAAGDAFNADLRKALNEPGGRIERIRSTDLDQFTPWESDWRSWPDSLRAFLMHAVASNREREESQEISARREQQKFRERYFVGNMLYHALNPEATQPIHSALYDLAWWGGDTSVFRQILARLGITVSEEHGRVSKIFAALEGQPYREAWLKALLSGLGFVMVVFDNLDWRGRVNRLHNYASSSNSGGIHITNIQLHNLDTGLITGIMDLDDTFRRRDTLEVEEVLGVGAAGSEALLKHTAHLLRQLQDEHEPTNGADGSSTTAWEFGLDSFLKMLRKEEMSEQELEYVKTNIATHQGRTRTYSLDQVSGKRVMTGSGATREPDPISEDSARLARNRACEQTTLTLLVDVPCDSSLPFPTRELRQGDVLTFEEAGETYFFVTVQRNTVADFSLVCVSDTVKFPVVAGEPSTESGDSGAADSDADSSSDEDGDEAARLRETFSPKRFPTFQSEAESREADEATEGPPSLPTTTPARPETLAAHMPESMSRICLLEAKDERCSDFDGVRRVLDEAFCFIKTVASTSSPDHDAQVERVAVVGDGQPARLMVEQSIRERRKLASHIASRKKDLAEHEITDATSFEESANMEAELRKLQDTVAKGPTELLLLGHMHARQNMYALAHQAFRLSFLAMKVGYREQKLQNLLTQAKGYLGQNEAFFRQHWLGGMLAFHRLACTQAKKNFALSEAGAWMGFLTSFAKTRATIAHWLDYLCNVCLPIIALHDAVSGRAADGVTGDVVAGKEHCARLEKASLQTFLPEWFALNHTTYYKVVAEYLTLLATLSPRWSAVHAHNLGVRISGPNQTAHDQAMESVGNRENKRMSPKPASAEDAIEASKSVNAHMALQRCFQTQASIDRDGEEAPTPKSARDPAKNIQVFEACFIERVTENAECLVEHAEVLTVFERHQSQPMRVTAEQRRAEGTLRAERYMRDQLKEELLGQYEAPPAEKEQMWMTFSKMKLFPGVGLTAGQATRKAVMLAEAAAESALLGSSKRGPHQLASFDPAGDTFQEMFVLGGKFDKSTYRDAVLKAMTAETAEGTDPDLSHFLGQRVRKVKPGVRDGDLVEVISSSVGYPSAPELACTAAVVDAMFSLRKGKAPKSYNGKRLQTGADLVAWWLSAVAKGIARQGFTHVALIFDAQAPPGKKSTERWRDRLLQRKLAAVPDEDLTVDRGALRFEVRADIMQRIASCRDVARNSFLALLDELLRDPSWVAELDLPVAVSVSVIGASRSTLGARIDLHTNGAGSTSAAVRPGTEALKHQEADTACVAVALQYGLHRRRALILSQDNDVLLASLCGLPAAAAAAGEDDEAAVRAAVRLVHLEGSTIRLKPDGTRLRKQPKDEAERQAVRTSQVMAIGEIALDLCFGDSAMPWLAEGPSRALTLAFAATLFGGDTVEKISGFSPASGVDALLFLREHLSLPPDGHDGPEVSEATITASMRLVLAAVYRKHKSLFAVSGSEADANRWVAEQADDGPKWKSFALARYLDKRQAKVQVLTTSQVEAQAAKAEARVTEWARSHLLDPGLLQDTKDAEGRFVVSVAQMKGLVAHTDGEPTPSVPITFDNAGSRFGVGLDHDAFAQLAAAALDASATATTESSSLSNSSVNALSDSMLEGQGLKKLNLAIKARSPMENKGKAYGRTKAAAEALRRLVNRGFEPRTEPAPPPPPTDTAVEMEGVDVARAAATDGDSDGTAAMQVDASESGGGSSGGGQGRRRRRASDGGAGGGGVGARGGTGAGAAADSAADGGAAGGAVGDDDGERLEVGERIEVLWSAVRMWYVAVVTGYEPDTGLHSITYDDGDHGTLNTRRSAQDRAYRRREVSAPKRSKGSSEPARAATNNHNTRSKHRM